jgi:hypothetical protein
LVELSDSELFEIGIVKDGKDVYYNNRRLNGDYSHIGFSLKSIPQEKKVQTNYEFHAIYSTTIDYVPKLPFGLGRFFFSMDTLVPVILKVGNPTYTPVKPDEIWWFNPHPDLFEKLPSRYKYLKEVYSNLICLKNKNSVKSFTNYLSPSGNNIFKNVNSINMNKEELRQIGINVVEASEYEKCIVLQSNDDYQLSSRCFCNKDKTSKHERSWYDSLDIVRVGKSCLPILKTDSLGRKLYFSRNSNYQEIVEKYSDILIPIKIDFSKLLNDIGSEPELWWYYPSDEFIQLLPDRIKHELKLERDAIISNQKVASSTCTYFEACKSTLDTKLRLFPNPAKTSVTLEFECAEDMTGSISLVNISGAVVKQLLSSAFIHSGKNSFNLELSGIEAGIYLVYLNTNKGFVTQKLIINQ